MSKVGTINGKVAVDKNGKIVTVGSDSTLVGIIDRSVTEIELPKGVNVGKYTFAECDKLKKVIISEGATYIYNNAFLYCRNLLSIVIPDSVVSIGSYAFSTCGLTTIKLPSGLKTLEQAVLFQCELTSLDIPKSVTTIKNNALQYCFHLTYLEIPNSVTTIGSASLQIGSTENKATIKFLGTTPPTITATTFDTTKLEKILVPKGYGDTYKQATNWTNFADYIFESEE